MPMSDLGQWLSNLGLPQYAAAFEAQAVELDQLAELSDADLRELGVAALGHRKRLLKAIADRLDGKDAADAAATPQDRVPPPSPAPAAGAERRHLSVMFCDLVGSTQLATQLDPEDLQQLVGDYHQTVATAVRPFAGHVAQFLGDGVLVYYGYPQAHEDDALRAVRAGLAVLDAIARRYGSGGGVLDTMDGIGISFADWRFNVRMSNTEPLVRLNVESRGDHALMVKKTAELLAFLDGG